MLCTLLDGDPPAERTTPPCRSADLEATPDQVGLEQEQDGDGIDGNGAQANTERSSTPPLATARRREGETLGVDGDGGGGGGSRLLSGDAPARDEETREDEKPEKSRFNVLLGMLTIATMVDAEGEAASSWAAKSSSGMGQDGHETDDGTKSGRNTRMLCLGEHPYKLTRTAAAVYFYVVIVLHLLLF